MFPLVVNVNITAGEKKINHVLEVPQFRSPSSKISETFGAGRNVSINLVLL